MKKKVYRVRTQYIFDGVFELIAESREEARKKVLQNCGLVMGGSVHSTLPDDEINWAFDRHPNKRIGRKRKCRNSVLNNNKSHANFWFAWLLFFLFERVGDQRKEAKESRKIQFIILNLNKIMYICKKNNLIALCLRISRR